MRNLIFMAVAALLVVFVLLPLMGALLGVLLILVAVVAAGVLAAPLLAKLPWFRDRIHVEDVGGRKTVRFGNGVFTSYRGRGPEPPTPDRFGGIDSGDVIDVQGRELPDEKE